MQVKVHMTAYCVKSDIRVVDIPDEEIKSNNIEYLLDLVVKYGQNTMQPQNQVSVSFGDVITLQDRYFFVLNNKFKEINEKEFNSVPDRIAFKNKFYRKLENY